MKIPQTRITVRRPESDERDLGSVQRGRHSVERFGIGEHLQGEGTGKPVGQADR